MMCHLIVQQEGNSTLYPKAFDPALILDGLPDSPHPEGSLSILGFPDDHNMYIAFHHDEGGSHEVPVSGLC